MMGLRANSTTYMKDKRKSTLASVTLTAFHALKNQVSNKFSGTMDAFIGVLLERMKRVYIPLCIKTKKTQKSY